MGSRIECFWLDPVAMARSELRRYENADYKAPPSCPANRMSHHDTTAYLEDVPYPLDAENGGYGRDDVPHDDPRWPRVCETCGYAFRDTDYWQHNVTRLYRGAPDGKLYTNRMMPPGALFDATWWPEKGPDGVALAVVLPPRGGDNIWMPDAPAKNSGKPWVRTGKPPKVTATPSILTPTYHGFLTDGWLVEC